MSSIKLTADSGGGTVEIKAPATTESNGAKQLIVSKHGIIGITDMDQWRLTTNFQGAVEPLANNLERNDNNFTKIGDGMSVSSGHWTFPSTGIWWVQIVRDAYVNGNDREVRVMIYRSTDGSSFSALTENASNIKDFSNNAHGQVVSHAVFDVQNTSTHKVYFRILNDNGNTNTIGRDSENQTYMTFIRLGDT
tara:strand:+ start:2360 stop:2938 length:579 start_codon:yes stop_codon:yes gene_type:complete